jgi:hypothetical protein
VKEIQLTRGYVALVDDADYERVSQFKWYALPTGNTVYAQRGIHRPDGPGQTKQMMHRFILGLTDPKICTDHIDRNGLNNQRSNLREATNQQNQWNSAKHKDSPPGVKGVHWVAAHKRYRVTIKFDGKRLYLGQYKTKAEADAVASAFRQKHHGVFARAIKKSRKGK